MLIHVVIQRGPTAGPPATCGPRTEFLRPASFRLSIS